MEFKDPETRAEKIIAYCVNHGVFPIGGLIIA